MFEFNSHFNWHFSFLQFFIKGKILWHLRLNHRIILTYSTFEKTAQCSMCGVIKVFLFYIFVLFHEAVTISHCSQKHCEYQSNIYERWWCSRLEGQPSHTAEEKLMTQSLQEKPFLRETTCIAFIKSPRRQTMSTYFSGESRRRSAGEQGHVWIYCADRLSSLYWSCCCLKCLHCWLSPCQSSV